MVPSPWKEKSTRWSPSSLRKISRYSLKSVGRTQALREIADISPNSGGRRTRSKCLPERLTAFPRTPSIRSIPPERVGAAWWPLPLASEHVEPKDSSKSQDAMSSLSI